MTQMLVSLFKQYVVRTILGYASQASLFLSVVTPLFVALIVTLIGSPIVIAIGSTTVTPLPLLARLFLVQHQGLNCLQPF